MALIHLYVLIHTHLVLFWGHFMPWDGLFRQMNMTHMNYCMLYYHRLKKKRSDQRKWVIIDQHKWNSTIQISTISFLDRMFIRCFRWRHYWATAATTTAVKRIAFQLCPSRLWWSHGLNATYTLRGAYARFTTICLQWSRRVTRQQHARQHNCIAHGNARNAKESLTLNSTEWRSGQQTRISNLSFAWAAQSRSKSCIGLRWAGVNSSSASVQRCTK